MLLVLLGTLSFGAGFALFPREGGSKSLGGGSQQFLSLKARGPRTPSIVEAGFQLAGVGLSFLRLARLGVGTLAAAEDVALRLGSYARGTLGPRNEQLTCFGVAPLKKRRPPRPDELDANPAKVQEDAA